MGISPIQVIRTIIAVSFLRPLCHLFYLRGLRACLSIPIQVEIFPHCVARVIACYYSYDLIVRGFSSTITCFFFFGVGEGHHRRNSLSVKVVAIASMREGLLRGARATLPASQMPYYWQNISLINQRALPQSQRIAITVPALRFPYHAHEAILGGVCDRL